MSATGMEDADQVYAALMKAHETDKGKVTLERLRGACDYIVSNQMRMNYSRVAKTAISLYGGPANSTIQGSSDWKRYIDARLRDYTSGNKGVRASGPGVSGKGSRADKTKDYPVSGLDSRTKDCIDTLRKRLEVQTRLADGYRKDLESARRESPIDIAALRIPAKLNSDSGRT